MFARARRDATVVAFSVVSFHEQILGAHTLISQARTDTEIVKGYRLFGEILQSFSRAPVLLFDTTAATVFEDLRAQRIRLATMDLRIASTALSRNLILVTRNARDFEKVPDLAIEDWTK